MMQHACEVYIDLDHFRHLLVLARIEIFLLELA